MLKDLLPALSVQRDIRIQLWQDSHLTCGEQLLPGIIDPLDQADYGLPLLSNAYFASAFIRQHELPRFAGPTADKGSLPVLLCPLPGFGDQWDLHGVEHQTVFTREGRSFQQLSRPDRTIFANDLANAIRRRLLGLNGYHPL